MRTVLHCKTTLLSKREAEIVKFIINVYPQNAKIPRGKRGGMGFAG